MDNAARCAMNNAYLSAIAALAGSAIGALASFATTWLTQRIGFPGSDPAAARAIAHDLERWCFSARAERLLNGIASQAAIARRAGFYAHPLTTLFVQPHFRHGPTKRLCRPA